MIKNLVIVESPAKAKTIEKFLGQDFIVKSCYGHIRDLEKKGMGIDIENDFTPKYKISGDKEKVVGELKKFAKDAETVWLASDEDREGEAISWHLEQVLGLKGNKAKRITFNEITPTAIKNAIQNPRLIDGNLVDSQQARRILDRLVGFEVSPLLWKKIKPELSAGRVQSVAVRLIVERDREIDAFSSKSSYKVTADFIVANDKGVESIMKADLQKGFDSEPEAMAFLELCIDSIFKIENLEKKKVTRTPAPPFTTSTLQQEAARKLRFPVGRTMRIAQSLYESGKITYMRTDSVNLSETALEAAKQEIISQSGPKYSVVRKYKTKSANAQEAHEAIRPTYFNVHQVEGTREEQALYQLIWRRAIASQMADAILERNIATIDISKSDRKFISQGEVILFDGFLKVYSESKDEDDSEKESSDILPPLTIGQILDYDNIVAIERFSRPSPRFTEAALVKKLEELGIGRPSTYASIISTIQDRGYIVKEDREGTERSYTRIRLNNKKKISKEIKTEIAGSEKGKLFAADLALLVTDFLIKEFPQIMDYKFTAKVEEELDEIAMGKLEGKNMLKEFYVPFHEKVEETEKTSKRITGERILGNDSKTGKQVSVRMARYGAVVQLSNPDDPNDTPIYAALKKGQKLESISLEEALTLLELPRRIGQFEEKDIVANIGRFGPYLQHNSKFYSLSKEFDPYTIDLDTSIDVILAKRKADSEKVIKSFAENPDIQILNGRWGPYLKSGKDNIKIPKGTVAETLTYDECIKLISIQSDVKKAPSRFRRGGKTKK